MLITSPFQYMYLENLFKYRKVTSMKKKIFPIVIKISMIVFILLLILALTLNISTLWSVREISLGETVSSGYFCAIVKSGSMEPNISINDLLVIKSFSSYNADDIITYISPQGAMITHRIKEVLNGNYITQGDANNIPDEVFSSHRVMGKVVFVIPGVGGAINGILSPIGILLLVCMGSIVWLVYRIKEE